MRDSLTLAAPTQHLRQLSLIRCLLLACLWPGLFCAHWLASATVGLPAAVLLVLTLVTGMTLVRLRQPLAVTELEFFVQLVVDVIGLIVLFYFTGGANNPLVSYLLVPLCISAATLPWRFTWAIASLSLVAYSVLLFFYVDFPLFALSQGEHSHHGGTWFNWHIIGMWFNFFLSATLITYFVVKMAGSLRRQQEAISQLREDELRHQQLTAVAMLAAGAAHEINTPLSTMTVLLQELRTEHAEQPELRADLELLSGQVAQCAASLRRLVKDSSEATRGTFMAQPITACCQSIIDRWQLMRPLGEFSVGFSGDQLEHSIALDPRLELAIINLLNNAADASPDNVSIGITATAGQLRWDISDTGAGIAPAAANNLGKSAFSTKSTGLGLGMMLAQVTLNSYGGSLSQQARKPQGTLTQVVIPIVSVAGKDRAKHE
jgi:two-component system, sensor histidine kinase RegB